MSSNLLVSICIPAYNAEKWIKSTIQSAIDQTYEPKEIIIVDDGSTDNTLKIAKEFESEMVKIFTQKNKGACAARNLAYKLSKGDFIQWLDADDILAPDKIEKQMSNCDMNPDSTILHSAVWGQFYYRLKSAKFKPSALWQDLLPVDWLISHLSKEHFMFPACWLVSRKLTELAGPWDERLSINQDGEYFCRVICASEVVKFHKNALCYYRKGSLSSISRSISYSDNAFISLNLSINLCVDYLLQLEDSINTRNACIIALNRAIAFGKTADALIIEKNKNRIFSLGGKVVLPPKSFKYSLVAMIFGTEIGNALKTKIWLFRILISRTFNKFIAIIFNDRV